MIISICNKEFDTENIYSIRIKDKEVMIDANNDFYRLPYSTEEEIREAKDWLRFKEISKEQIIDAASILMLVCDYYLNQYNQCEECPLQRNYGCLTQLAPMNWRNQNAARINETE